MARRRKGNHSSPKAGNGEGSIYYEKSGHRWVAALTINGKVRRRIAHSKDQANERLQELQALREQSRMASSGQQTLTQFLDTWLDGKQHDIREHSYQAYRQRCQHAADRIGYLRLDAIKPMDIDHYKSRLLSEGYKASTVTGDLLLLDMALQHAVDMEVIPRNPCERVSKPTARRIENPTFTLDELRRLLASTTGTYWHALWVLLATGGFRIGEALALHWSDYDEANAVLWIRGTVVRRRDGLLFVGPTKSDEGHRLVPIVSRARIALGSHRRLVLARHMSNRKAWGERDLIFPNRVGGLTARHVPARVLKNELRRLGLPERSPHAFRHETVSRLLGSHENISVVQKLHGHADPNTTLRHYSHVDLAMLRAAVERADTLLDEPGEADKKGHEKAE